MHIGALTPQVMQEARERLTDAATATLARNLPFASKAGRAAAGLGLVTSSTSGPPPLARTTIQLDPDKIRALRLRKSVITSARLHDAEARQGSARGRWYMVTTTYAPGSAVSPRDISGMVRHLRRSFHKLAARKGHRGAVFRYLWVGELQKRLVPHYHMLLWVPRGYWFGKPDETGAWPHGDTEFAPARNAVGYLAKYASKFTADMAKHFPKGFRTHAVGGLNDESKRELRWWKSPEDARTFLGVHADIRKVTGGYFDKLTGEFWPSPWRVYFDRGRTFAYKIEAIT